MTCGASRQRDAGAVRRADRSRPRAARLPARDEQLAQREHRRVGRQRVQRRLRVGPVGGRLVAAPRARSGWTRIRAGSMPAYFSRTASSGARLPLQVKRRIAAGEQLEVGVPDPGDVAAVGDLVVEHAEQVVLAGLERERAQHLVGAGRVLDEQDAQLARRRAEPSPAPLRAGEGSSVTVSARPNAARVPCSPATMLASGTSSARRERGGGERVVDVVEAGQRERAPAPRRRACAA